jgi:hypothetical protein
MRTIRRIATALVLSASVPMAAEAQSGRHFIDSWFWGAKAGNMVFSTTAAENVFSPQIGVEWLITRSRGALYLSFDQAFFDEPSTVRDWQGNVYSVRIRDSRRATAAALAFPMEWGNIRPYAGLGLAMTLITSARGTDELMTPQEEWYVRDLIADRKDRVAVLGMAGAQLQYRRFSVFGQGTLMPGQTTHLMNGGATWILETGIRYNVGSAIERIR